VVATFADFDWCRENDSTSHDRYVLQIAIRRSRELDGIVAETMMKM
jgi:hypothetical protein